VALPAAAQTDPPDDPVAEARVLAQSHRYEEAVRLLEPLAAQTGGDPQLIFSIAAELGRAFFHMGRYAQAHDQMERAAALRPDSIEVGIYRGATAYLTGRRELSFAIFREILRTGARDLYLPVVLPGERQFLAEPRVWELLSEHEVDLPVSLAEGSALGVCLGDDRTSVSLSLRAADTDRQRPVLSASAGPKMLWALRFGTDSRLEEVVVNAEHLLRYTPYRLRFACGLDWRATPESALEKLGWPDAMESAGGSTMLTWELPGASVSLAFSPVAEPRPLPLPDGVPLLSTIRLQRATAAAPGPADDASESEPPNI